MSDRADGKVTSMLDGLGHSTLLINLTLNSSTPDPRDASRKPPSYLRWDPVEVLAQHSPHVLASVRRHLVLQQEGEVAALADAVEVAVDLVVLAPWEERRAVNDPAAGSFISGGSGERAQHEVVAGTRPRHERQSGFFFFLALFIKPRPKEGSGFWVF